ncbi:MAG: PhnE/PtxC family ABC transporter permease [Gammaproteobacteria bacterium]
MTAFTGAERAAARPRLPATVQVSLVLCAIAFALAFVADLEIATLDPWFELRRMARGLVTPDFLATEHLARAVLYTVCFALIGVAVGSMAGFVLALVFQYRIVRVGSAFVRAVHELFWALIFLQVFGLTPVTGVLAIAIPYAGIFAKVFAEILEESDQSALRTVAPGTGAVSVFMFARLPDALAHFKTYTLYRLECGLRSSAVLGFVGLPTLGYHLESAFAQGKYSEVAALLLIFYLVISTIKLWVRARLVPVYLLVAVFALPWEGEIGFGNIVQFFTHDVLPHPLRVSGALNPETFAALGAWTWDLLRTQALPGVLNTIVLTQIALVGSGILTLLLFPLISPKFFGRGGRTVGHVFLVVARSTPEYVLTLVFLLLWGPSMLPAIVALSLHNGAIIGHLIGRYTEKMSMRPDRATGANLYFFEILPRVYGQFLAFAFYRWEVIMRETAILGILGVATLGFYIDSAFADLRFDRALLLILVTAFLNLGVDALSRTIRARLKLRNSPDLI